MISVAVLALLAAAAAVAVALPLLRAETSQQSVAKSRSAQAEAARLELLERRDRALAALRELGLELRGGSLSAADHDALAAPLRAEAAAALAELAGRAR